MTANTCKRKRCQKTRRNGHLYCTMGCSVVVTELASAHHVYEALGSSPITDQLLTAAENLEHAWGELQQARWEVRKAGLEAGWETSQINALMRGDITAKHTTPPTGVRPGVQ